MQILERLLDLIGEPLYYCAECKRRVRVTPVEGEEPVIQRFCEHHDAQIIAPRRAILTGDGTINSLPPMQRAAWNMRSFLSNLTGRNV
jgi:hypothetical protein